MKTARFMMGCIGLGSSIVAGGWIATKGNLRITSILLLGACAFVFAEGLAKVKEAVRG